MDYQRILAASVACLVIRGCAESAALMLPMICMVLQYQAIADMCGRSPDMFEASQTMQHCIRRPKVLQFATFLDAGMEILQTIADDRLFIPSQPGWLE